MGAYKIHTDDTLRETVVHGSQAYPFAYYPENIWEFDFHRIDWHWHNELEFLLVEKGAAICFAGDNRIELSEGSGVFINRGTLHRYETQSSAFCPNIVFDATLLAPEDNLIYEKYVKPVLRSSVAFQVLQPDVAWQHHILETLNRIFSIQETNGGNELHTIQLLLQCWDILYQNMDMDSISPAVRRLNHRQAKLQIMMQYIHNHYKEAITLDMIASSVPMSKSGALHIFRSCIQTSPVSYLIQYRLMQAATQLRSTQKSISSIAADTGFLDTGYFCRKFKQRYHLSANEYRRQNS